MLIDKYETIILKNRSVLLHDIATGSTENLELLTEVFELSADGRKYLGSFLCKVFVDIFEDSLKILLEPKCKTGSSDTFDKMLLPVRKRYTDLIAGNCDYAVLWTTHLAELKLSIDAFLSKLKLLDRYFSSMSQALSIILLSNSKSADYVNSTIDFIIRTEALKKGSCSQPSQQSCELFRILIRLPLALSEFVHHYKRYLAKRLIHYRKTRIEQHFIDTLVVEKGKVSIAPLQSMLNDVHESSALASGFTCEPIKFSPCIVSGSLWNLNFRPNDTTLLPPVLKNLIHKFEQFYRANNRNRVLTWSFTFGTALISVYLNQKKLADYHLPTYAMLTLLAFDNTSVRKSICFNEIKRIVKLPDKDIDRALTLLSSGSRKIIVKKKDTFHLNVDIDVSYISRVGQPQASSHYAEQSSSRRYSDEHAEDRSNERLSFTIDSAIISIIKSSKYVSHNDLLERCLFKINHGATVSPDIVESRIESLLKREYISKRKTVGGVAMYAM